MKTSITDKVLFVIALAIVGALLVFLPPKILEQYDRISKYGPPWTYLYFGLVGTGAAIFVTLAGMAAWKVWANTREKRLKHERREKSPSALSASEKQQE